MVCLPHDAQLPVCMGWLGMCNLLHNALARTQGYLASMRASVRMSMPLTPHHLALAVVPLRGVRTCQTSVQPPAPCAPAAPAASSATPACVTSYWRYGACGKNCKPTPVHNPAS